MQLFAFNVDVNVKCDYRRFMSSPASLSAASKKAGHASPEDSPAAQWGIQDFAKIFRITPRTLRFYEDKGLISPDRQNGSRIYGPRDYVRTERVIRAKQLGFSLDDIRDLFEVIDGKVKGKSALMQRKALMEDAATQLRRNRKNIDSALNELEVLIGRIDDYVQTAEEDGVFQHAAAYEAMFAKTLADSDEDYILGYPARSTDLTATL